MAAFAFLYVTGCILAALCVGHLLGATPINRVLEVLFPAGDE